MIWLLFLIPTALVGLFFWLCAGVDEQMKGY
jgi:hypothetical protein